MLGELQRNRRLEVHRRAARHVVETDRGGGGVGDRGEMAEEPALGGLVVVRRGGEDVVGAQLAHSPSFGDGPGRVVAARAGHHGRAARGGLDHRGDHPLALGVVHRLRLAGRAAGNQKVDLLGDLPFHQRAQGGVVHLAAVGERGDQRRPASLQASHPVPPKSIASKSYTPVRPGSHSAAASAPAAKPRRLRATCWRVTVSCGPS